MEIHNQAFGKTVRKFRLQKKLTQERLGFESGLDRTYVSLLELGINSPTLDTIVTVCKALDVPLSVFFQEVERYIKGHQ